MSRRTKTKRKQTTSNVESNKCSKVEEKDDSTNNCSICLTEFTNKTKLNNCAHCFCYKCIDDWTERQLAPSVQKAHSVQVKCPLCKTAYTSFVDSNEREEKVDFEKIRINQDQFLIFEKVCKAYLYEQEDVSELPSWYAGFKAQLDRGNKVKLLKRHPDLTDAVINKIALQIYPSVLKKQMENQTIV